MSRDGFVSEVNAGTARDQGLKECSYSLLGPVFPSYIWANLMPSRLLTLDFEVFENHCRIGTREFFYSVIFYQWP